MNGERHCWVLFCVVWNVIYYLVIETQITDIWKRCILEQEYGNGKLLFIQATSQACRHDSEG